MGSINPVLTYFAKITESFISLAFKSLIESRFISSNEYNIHKMHGPNIHAVFGQKKNF